MLDLRWPYKRHSEIFAGIQRYAEEHGWVSILDEYANDTLRLRPQAAVPYDGIIARANTSLVQRATAAGVPVVNVWPSSPVWRRVPGVFPDSLETGRMVAEHLLARGFRNFATLTSVKNRDNEDELKAFTRLVQQAGGRCLSTSARADGGEHVASGVVVHRGFGAERGVALQLKLQLASFEPHDVVAPTIVVAAVASRFAQRYLRGFRTEPEGNGILRFGQA
jgi:DNA-binding LacI/PurR family transcriptional regulator